MIWPLCELTCETDGGALSASLRLQPKNKTSADQLELIMVCRFSFSSTAKVIGRDGTASSPASDKQANGRLLSAMAIITAAATKLRPQSMF